MTRLIDEGLLLLHSSVLIELVTFMCLFHLQVGFQFALDDC